MLGLFRVDSRRILKMRLLLVILIGVPANEILELLTPVDGNRFFGIAVQRLAVGNLFYAVVF